MAELRFERQPDASRWALFDGDDLAAVLDYRDDGRSVAMVRSFTVPTFRGKGYAAIVVDRAVAELETAGDRTVVPVCWYVDKWFAEHPDRAGILAVRA